MNNYFPKIIGQYDATEQLSMFIDAHKNGQAIPNLLLDGPGGVGKTHTATQYTKALGKPLLKADGTTIKNKKQIAEKILIPIQDRDMVVLIDEVGEANPDALQILLPVLDKKASKITELEWDGVTLRFDFRRVCFILATTDKHRLSAPLLTRLKVINFDDYEPDELAKIVKLNLSNFGVEDEALADLMNYSRGDGRWAASLAENVESFCSAKAIDVLTADLLKDFKRITGIYEMGLMKAEIKMLKALREFPTGTTLKVLSTRTKMAPKAQQDLERYPESKGLMEINGKRRITQKGIELLKRIGQ